MNQIKIGQFIATCRKEKNLTQNQLAEKLNITNKAISKWETGRGIPDASLLLELCEILDINVNELLNGEKIASDRYKEKAEENIISFIKETDKNTKKTKIFLIISMIMMIFIIIITSYCDITYFFNPKFNSSNQKMLIIQRNDENNDANIIFYCIFNKNGKCEACFCEFTNPPSELLNQDMGNGYIRKNKIDNVLYTEYTGLRGFNYQEIKDMFKDDIIIKEW